MTVMKGHQEEQWRCAAEVLVQLKRASLAEWARFAYAWSARIERL